MNDRSDIEQVLGYWFEDGPATMPARVVDVVARRISLRPQRRSWRFLRRSSMSPALKYGIAAAAVLVIAIGGYSLLPRNGSIGGPGPSPTPVVTPIPSATGAPATAAARACDEPASVCAGALAVGVNSSVAFQPKLTFTVPVGWTNTLDKDRAYTMHYNFTRGHFLQVLSQLAIPVQNAGCTAERKAGVGNGVADWVNFLTTNAGLTATAPQAITIGGYSGMQLDVHRSDTWTATCPNSLGPAVVLFTNNATVPDRVRWIDDQQVTIRILDVAGETVIIYLEAGHPDDLVALNETFKPVFDSFKFTPAS